MSRLLLRQYELRDKTGIPTKGVCQSLPQVLRDALRIAEMTPDLDGAQLERLLVRESSP